LVDGGLFAAILSGVVDAMPPASLSLSLSLSLREPKGRRKTQNEKKRNVIEASEGREYL
jgi:hypothetical protein